MTQLTNFTDDVVFYKGTIIVIKNAQVTPKGNFDKKYCLIGNCGGMGNFGMLDLYRSMGGCIIHDLPPNVKGHVGVNKEGIKEWVRKYFELFYTKENYENYLSQLNDIIFIEDLDDYFTQANRDLFIV